VLLDLVHPDYVRRQFEPSSWHEADEDVVVCRQRKLLKEGVLAREIVLSKREGLIRDVTYFARVFQPGELETLLTDSGFILINTGGAMVSQSRAGDYGLLGKRMLVTAHKP
jgi:D-alanine-D-alanine ligase